MENLPNYTWIFSGIGTELITSLVTIIFVGIITYKVTTKRNIRQKQTAGKNLKIAKDWWNNIPIAFNLTSVGRSLAYANLKRIDPQL